MFVFFFAGFLTIIAPGWGFSTSFLPQGLVFCTFFVPGGWGIRPFKKNSPRGLSGLELTDTLVLNTRF